MMQKSVRELWLSEAAKAVAIMSAENAEKYMVEIEDHMTQLERYPQMDAELRESIAWRTSLYQAGPMRVPPMLMPTGFETAEQHREREMEAGGYGEVSQSGSWDDFTREKS